MIRSISSRARLKQQGLRGAAALTLLSALALVEFSTIGDGNKSRQAQLFQWNTKTVSAEEKIKAYTHKQANEQTIHTYTQDSNTHTHNHTHKHK